MINQANVKAFISAGVAVLLLIIMGIVLYQKFSVPTAEYSGTQNEIESGLKPDVIVKGESFDSDKIEFIQRSLRGGGINPGWVLSLVETQPNVFTGRVLIDDGVYQYPVTLREEVGNIFIGEIKSKDKKIEIFSLRKNDKECTDSEGNLFEYSLSGSYGATEIYGCGGEVIQIALE